MYLGSTVGSRQAAIVDRDAIRVKRPAMRERTFVTSDGRPGARLQRALAARNLISAEQAAFEIAFISLAQARELVELYAEKGDPKYERAALKYLTRYMAEGSPSLADVAQIAAVLAERGLLMRGL